MMKQTIEGLKVRADKLKKKDAVGNARIISKLNRKIRKLEN